MLLVVEIKDAAACAAKGLDPAPLVARDLDGARCRIALESFEKTPLDALAHLGHPLVYLLDDEGGAADEARTYREELDSPAALRRFAGVSLSTAPHRRRPRRGPARRGPRRVDVDAPARERVPPARPADRRRRRGVRRLARPLGRAARRRGRRQCSPTTRTSPSRFGRIAAEPRRRRRPGAGSHRDGAPRSGRARAAPPPLPAGPARGRRGGATSPRSGTPRRRRPRRVGARTRPPGAATGSAPRRSASRWSPSRAPGSGWRGRRPPPPTTSASAAGDRRRGWRCRP